ncbi:hypothetical protein FEM48_Zijuj06G0179800 [Ziziphus jujuba var. spinosa]|uniref:Pentatricopeptide repeat-containing protein n=1 Tax=Ziziphus jujuba var. spinosa TaxID=714518 RepID=A0A978VAS5_ZIZJJ|nr:hypothetical protein FEM48_Zijuj06G0179800 [Ziziphus jujuba var. spinosa]
MPWGRWEANDEEDCIPIRPFSPDRSHRSELKPRSFKSLRFPGESFDASSPSSLIMESMPFIAQTQNPEVADSPTPDGKHGSSSKSYIWVNPSSPRASQLRRKSYDASYARMSSFPDQAVEWFEKMPTFGWNFDGCLNVYEEMKAIGARTNLVIYNTLLDAMGRAKRPWQAKKIYKEMTENRFSPNWMPRTYSVHNEKTAQSDELPTNLRLSVERD